jgi:hypothetical protein
MDQGVLVKRHLERATAMIIIFSLSDVGGEAPNI